MGFGNKVTSGVFIVRRVHRAFQDASPSSRLVPLPEDLSEQSRLLLIFEGKRKYFRAIDNNFNYIAVLI